MNYNDEILENKLLNWFKQLMYNIVLAICIMLACCLIPIYGFGYIPYNVLTGSMTPAIYAGDMVVVKEQDSYEIGDILTYSDQKKDTDTITHRLIATVEYGGTTYYICHGDAALNMDGTSGDGEWEDDVEYVKDWTYSDFKSTSGLDYQMITANMIKGKVVAVVRNLGAYYQFVYDHKWLLVAMVIAIWGLSSTFQNENEIKRTQRLLY